MIQKRSPPPGSPEEAAHWLDVFRPPRSWEHLPIVQKRLIASATNKNRPTPKASTQEIQSPLSRSALNSFVLNFLTLLLTVLKGQRTRQEQSGSGNRSLCLLVMGCIQQHCRYSGGGAGRGEILPYSFLNSPMTQDKLRTRPHILSCQPVFNFRVMKFSVW